MYSLLANIILLSKSASTSHPNPIFNPERAASGILIPISELTLFKSVLLFPGTHPLELSATILLLILSSYPVLVASLALVPFLSLITHKLVGLIYQFPLSF